MEEKNEKEYKKSDGYSFSSNYEYIPCDAWHLHPRQVIRIQRLRYRNRMNRQMQMEVRILPMMHRQQAAVLLREPMIRKKVQQIVREVLRIPILQM